MSDYLEQFRKSLNADALLYGQTESHSPDFDRLMDVALGRLVTPKTEKTSRRYYWGPEKYGLDQSSYYRRLPLSKQEEILSFLSSTIMHSLYFLEKMGSSYAAKMLLCAPTFQEREFFSLQAMDELIHRHELLPYFNRPPESTERRSFSSQVACELIKCSYSISLLVTQVLFEGFGMTHYTELKDQCLDGSLQKVFQRILKDEGRHYGGGLLLYPLNPVRVEEIADFKVALLSFLKTADEYQNLILGSFKAAGLALDPNEIERLLDEARIPAQINARRDCYFKHFKVAASPDLYERMMRELV